MKKAKRGRPPIALEVQRFIAEKALEDRNRPRKELAYELESLIRDKGWPAPTVETLKKKISEARQKPSPLDRPFTLGALVDHPIPPEALPTVLEAWAQYRKGEGTFTIREALWFSRLSGILREFQRVGDKDRRNLANLVLWYSVRERAYEAIGETIDTADLDTEVLRLLGLIEREQEEGGATPWIVKDGQLMDGTGKIRGQLRVTTQNEDGSQPWGQKEEGGTE